MFPFSLALILCAQPGGSRIEPEHAANPVYRATLDGSISYYGTEVRLPAPILRDGQSADEQKAALVSVVGSAAAVGDLLRDSVTAPIKMKTGKIEASGASLATVDLWFSVRGEIDQIDPAKAAEEAKTSKAVEAGNMKFETRPISAEELAARKLEAVAKGGPAFESYSHSEGLLLDRVFMESTARLFATRSAGSLVIASRTAPAFDDDPEFPNRWRKIETKAGKQVQGPFQAYPGGLSYLKISRLDALPGMLLVEAHMVFAEPDAWFNRAAILRSKISLVAQDQIRDLRRDLAKKREENSKP